MKRIYNINNLESISNLCPEERETTINVLGTEQTMSIYTSDNSMLTKLKKIWASNPDNIECYEMGRCGNKVTGYCFKMNKKHLSIRNASNRKMSEEAKAAFSEKVKRMHAEKKLKNKIP